MKKIENSDLQNNIPPHLKKFLVPQNYKKYSAEDQAVWRFIMKGISKNLSLSSYGEALKSLKEKGIDSHRIPKIKDIDNNLQAFGWRAACISGFIPPRAFMEFQKNKILPIASELRTIKHIFYTPAPDIVHEAVGHVPFLDHPVFSNFLSSYAETVLKAITSYEDMEKYKAIRDLSDLKENLRSSPLQIKKQEKKLKQIIQNISYTSESAYLSRLIWWTSEYGLIGSLKNPKVYGAGLISSIGELLHLDQVKKIKLSPRCVEYPFDITSFQPQLFVAKNFEHLLETLDKLSQNLAFRRGGVYGIQQALLAKTVNTVVLNSGLQISGVLEKSLFNQKQIHFLKFKGPVQLCYKNKQLKGHGTGYHKEGYSSPLILQSVFKGGLYESLNEPFFLTSRRDLSKLGFKEGKSLKLKFSGGIKMEGEFVSDLRDGRRLLSICFKNCLITDSRGRLLYHPSWGAFDLAIGSKVVSVFSGPADMRLYPLEDDFKPSKIALPKRSHKEKKRHQLYQKIRSLKSKNSKTVLELFKAIKKENNNWLLFLELLDSIQTHSISLEPSLKKQILTELKALKRVKLQGFFPFKMGQELYHLG